MTTPTIAEIQFNILDTYFSHLRKEGYMDDVRSSQIATAVLLLDTFDFFADYVTDAYVESVMRYVRKSNCCNCAINWSGITKEACVTCEDE